MDGAGDFRLQVDTGDDGTVLTVSGEVDMVSGSEFVSVLRQAVLAAETRVHVDLSEVTYFGSEGVQGLVIAERLGRDRGIELSLVGSAVVARALEVTGLSDLIESRAG